MTTDELRAKFEAEFSQPPYEWSFRRHNAYGAWPDCYRDYNVQCAWNGYVNGHASRDAEVDALRKDAERYRWLRLKCTDELCVRKGVALVTGAALNAAVDAAMREESK